MKIALVGFGYWGPNLARNLNALGLLYAICEINDARIQKAKSIYGEGLVYCTDYHECIDDPHVDAIALAAFAEVNPKIAAEALKAGKHVFIEKPIATRLSDVEELNTLAQAKSLIVHCDHIMVYNPVIRYIKNMIDTGELGDLLYIDVSRVNLGPIRKDVNAMLDLAVHDIAVIDYLSNGEMPVHLRAVGRPVYGQQESLVYLTVQYPSFIAHIKTSWVSPVKERRTVIAGSKKMVIFDDLQNDKLAIYNHGIEAQMGDEYGQVEYANRVGDILYPHIDYEDSLRNSVMHFRDCVQTGQASLSGFVSSKRVTQILEMAMNSLKENTQ